jgi:AcrR family transcriptional regulator
VTTPSATTKDRILAAATAEFAAHGLAGARVDRIASAAGVNKERIYAHIGDKVMLFSAVVEANMADLATQVRLDPLDLPESAGRLFDHITASPTHMRIMDWARLEGADGLVSMAESGDPNRLVRVEAVAEAQRAGDIRTDVSAIDIVVSIFALATGWLHAPLSLVAIGTPQDCERRAFVVDSVRRFLAPDGHVKAENGRLRWPGLEREVDCLGPGEGVALYPPPFTGQGRDLGAASRRPVPVGELLALHDDIAKQLNA